MEKISIISKEVTGGHAGYLKDNPKMIAIGATPVEMVQNLIQIAKQKELKKEKI
jgi:hypothetical protein